MSTGGAVLWEPDAERIAASELVRLQRWVSEHGRASGPVDTYQQLWRWSVEDLDGFWRSLAELNEFPYVEPPSGSVAPTMVPGSGWFAGTTTSYAERVLGPERSGVAVVSVAEDGRGTETGWAELRRQVAAFSTVLRDAGVRHGDRVVAVLPVGLPAVVAQLAAAAVGAVWSVVAPEFGQEAIVSRLSQLEPVVLVAVAGYVHGGRVHDRSEVLATVLAGLPSLREVVWVGAPLEPAVGPARVRTWEEVTAGEHALVMDPVPFEHPLWVLFSSGTTGVPKGIVHSHGGIVLEHTKVLTVHADLRSNGVLLVVGSTSWVVWSMQVSGLLVGATIVLLEGNPAGRGLDRVWRVAAEQGVTVLGVGAAYVHASLQAGLTPREDHDLSALRMLQVTGSPLSPEGFAWVYRAVGEVWLASMSGGTDVASVFVAGVASAPVRSGCIQGPALGVAVAAWDDDGHPVVGARGELVITAPMPSMPLEFWNDPDGSRYRDSYFSTWPGTWRHGDFLEIDADGSCVIHGRSDSTLNRNGIRMGSADVYRAVENLPAVAEALVVGVEEGEGYYMPLYVQLVEGADVDEALEAIRSSIRAALSPRYLPDEIIVVRAVPHTRTGKKLEVPIRRLLLGDPIERVVDLGAVDDADLVREYAALARTHLDQHDHRRSAGPNTGAQPVAP